MPKRLPIRDIVSGLLSSLGTAIRYWLHYTVVAFAWLGIVPLTACRIYRCLFTGSVSSLLTLPLDMLSTENLLSDSLYGCCIVTCTLCAFISLVWLREQVIHGEGPDWLEQDPQNVEGLAEAEPGEVVGPPLGPVPHHAEEPPAQADDHVAQDDINWNPIEWDRAAEELTWERGRRESRAKTLLKGYGRDKEALFVDVAEYPSHKSYVAAVINTDRKCESACFIRSDNSEISGEVAIAQAIIFPKCRYVISDSQSAIRNYERGRISPEATNILLHKLKLISSEEFEERYIIWFPAHTSCAFPIPNLNEEAHRVARGLTYRTRDGASHEVLGGEEWWERDRMFRFCDIIQ
ncbi:hypothetical protein HPB51_023633 [Rhipicephalus microplus]|uniref:RING-type E3 ubiquitin transferase n=1 Tax=Rhipicephalus microplus TaxID=6941 RepID=A0A9J6DD17_RHIMP|nr:hypothetical protein HPB51_023633 [Rhipicephalus microplus]